MVDRDCTFIAVDTQALDMMYDPGLVNLLESITKADTPDQKNKKGLVETPNKKSTWQQQERQPLRPRWTNLLKEGKQMHHNKKAEQRSKGEQEEIKETEQMPTPMMMRTYEAKGVTG